MKLSGLLNIILAVALAVVVFFYVRERGDAEPKETATTTEKTTEAMQPHEAQWRQVSLDSIDIDAFQLFRNAAALTVGNADSCNSMTIGWGELGILWGGDRRVATVYVRRSRFTYHLMESLQTFTIEGFSPQYSDNLQYLGSASGRDEDKMSGSGMTKKLLPSGNIAFEEGNVIIECRKLYSYEMRTLGMDTSVVNRWYMRGKDFDDLHTAYVGEITAVWVKE